MYFHSNKLPSRSVFVFEHKRKQCWAGHFQGWALLNHLEKAQHPPNTLRSSRSWPGVLALMGAGCASVKRGMLIRFPRLIFFSPYWSSETPKVDLQPKITKTITIGDDSMRHRKEPGLPTSGCQGLHDSLNLRMEKIKASDLQGSKCALGAWAALASLSIFKEGFLKGAGGTSRVRKWGR